MTFDWSNSGTGGTLGLGLVLVLVLGLVLDLALALVLVLVLGVLGVMALVMGGGVTGVTGSISRLISSRESSSGPSPVSGGS